MSSFPLPSLISTARLSELLARPDLVVLDGSWYLPGGRDARGEYLAGHIPGAIWFDLDQASDPASPLPHMLPDETAFARYVGGLGIGDDTAVVVYDGSGANLSAARIWWMFRVFGHERVALLDGGLGKWRAEGRRLELGEASRRPAAEFTAALDRTRIRDRSQVAEALARGTAQVVDVRASGRFAGTDPEPRPGLPSGHMPGSVNLPYTELVHGDGTVLAPAEAAAALQRAGIRLGGQVIASCGSGTSACTLLFTLHRLGHDGVLYDGSWTDWAGSGMPIARRD